MASARGDQLSPPAPERPAWEPVGPRKEKALFARQDGGLAAYLRLRSITNIEAIDPLLQRKLDKFEKHAILSVSENGAPRRRRWSNGARINENSSQMAFPDTVKQKQATGPKKLGGRLSDKTRMTALSWGWAHCGPTRPSAVGKAAKSPVWGGKPPICAFVHWPKGIKVEGNAIRVPQFVHADRLSCQKPFLEPAFEGESPVVSHQGPLRKDGRFRG